ncbi:hypothetical protein ACFQZZ_07575 [Nocardia sp. GCM10030253]|uniref:hypothetical protein n=1 Tax=Nocardia sp. GCM10030253 TaxID=3273404 RepID=UPI0036338BDD
MVTTRNCQRSARIATVFAAMGAALVLAAAPALAEDTVDITGATPSTVAVSYNCDAAAGVKTIQAMAGEPTAERPAALGSQHNPTCDGTRHVATIPLTGATGEAPLQSGAVMQLRVALVDQNDIVVSGQAKVLTLTD